MSDVKPSNKQESASRVRFVKLEGEKEVPLTLCQVSFQDLSELEYEWEFLTETRFPSEYAALLERKNGESIDSKKVQPAFIQDRLGTSVEELELSAQRDRIERRTRETFHPGDPDMAVSEPSGFAEIMPVGYLKEILSMDPYQGGRDDRLSERLMSLVQESIDAVEDLSSRFLTGTEKRLRREYRAPTNVLVNPSAGQVNKDSDPLRTEKRILEQLCIHLQHIQPDSRFNSILADQSQRKASSYVRGLIERFSECIQEIEAQNNV